MKTKQINGTAAEIEAARKILDAGGIPIDTYWYQAIVGDEFGSDEHRIRSAMVTSYTNTIRVLGKIIVHTRYTVYNYFNHDESLELLGDDFYHYVCEKERINAAQTLVAIEKRVQELEGVPL